MLQQRTETTDRISVQLVHQSPGRLRLRIPARRRDHEFFDAVAEIVSACEGVTSVTTNPLTGSILIRYTGALDDLVAYAGLFGLLPQEAAEPSAPAAAAAGRTGDHAEAPLDQLLSVFAGTGAAGLDLSRPIAAAFLIFGLVQLAQGNIMAPAVTLFWYATQALQSGSGQTGGSGRASGTAPPEDRDPAPPQEPPAAAERPADGAAAAGRRKDADSESDLGTAGSFYFRGPGDRVNLRAGNLRQFVDLAERIDDAIWMHHLRAGDYSRWLQDCIKDGGLAEEARRVERQPSPDPLATRRQIRQAVERRHRA